MTNPTRFRTVLCDGTKPNYQRCVVEETNAAMKPGALVFRTSDHSPNGVKCTTGEEPIVNTTGFDIGVVEIEEVRIDSTEKYDVTTAYADDAGCLVHWLKPGDTFLGNCDDMGGALGVGTQLEAGVGTLAVTTAAAFADTRHTFTIMRQIEDDDTIAKVKYGGFGPIDLT